MQRRRGKHWPGHRRGLRWLRLKNRIRSFLRDCPEKILCQGILFLDISMYAEPIYIRGAWNVNIYIPFQSVGIQADKTLNG